MAIKVADKNAQDLLGQYEQQAKLSCAPIFWRGEQGQVRNASMTILQSPERILGITNIHVADKIANLDSDDLQLGDMHLDPARLIARHETLDIATYDLSDVIHASRQHSPGTVTTWPITLPEDRDVLLVGGWPNGEVRERAIGEPLSFGFLWFAGRINGISERTISMELQIENSTAISDDYVVPGVDLGGWSGGAVFRGIDSGLIEHIELCGIIYESDSGSNVVFAHPLVSLRADGTFEN